MMGSSAHSNDPGDAHLVQLLRDAASGIRTAVESMSDTSRGRRADGHADQYEADVVADGVVTAMLLERGVGVLSEESGAQAWDRPLRVIVDPIDGSTNLSRGLDPYGPSLCVLDESGPRVGLVTNFASGDEYVGVRGSGAWRNGTPLRGTRSTDAHLIATGDPIAELQPTVWTRVSGASAHDLCRVADGTFDGYVDHLNTVSIWDYCAGALILLEAGGVVSERAGNPLFDWQHATGTRLIAAGSRGQLAQLQALLRTSDPKAAGSACEEQRRGLG